MLFRSVPRRGVLRRLLSRSMPGSVASSSEAGIGRGHGSVIDIAVLVLIRYYGLGSDYNCCLNSGSGPQYSLWFLRFSLCHDMGLVALVTSNFTGIYPGTSEPRLGIGTTIRCVWVRRSQRCAHNSSLIFDMRLTYLGSSRMLDIFVDGRIFIASPLGT